jgi:lysophospholipase L1-like esterase
LWNQFNESSSRLGSDNKFLQKPDLIILNIGANDALNGTNEEDIKNVLSE